VAILGGGCFWCTEAVYLEARGVTRVESGYMGGECGQPDLRAGVRRHHRPCRGGAAGIRSRVISYRDILEIFFTIHDPTTLNRQGNDVGPQYRSVIFTTSPEQEATARQVMAEMAAVWDAPIVTQMLPAQTWYKAEDYHQNYYAQHPLQGYCAFVVAPKVAKFRKMFAAQIAFHARLSRSSIGSACQLVNDVGANCTYWFRPSCTYSAATTESAPDPGPPCRTRSGTG
jgi:peptide-methionine (S)-S-oxide reductase